MKTTLTCGECGEPIDPRGEYAWYGSDSRGEALCSDCDGRQLQEQVDDDLDAAEEAARERTAEAAAMLWEAEQEAVREATVSDYPW